MADELKPQGELEILLDEIISACENLLEDNQRLRAECNRLGGQMDSLNRRQQAAKDRVNHLLDRMQSMEQIA